jgi:AraC-like DNA-binding protein
MFRISLATGEPLLLRPSPAQKFIGLKIPGSSLLKSERADHAIILHVFKHRFFTITLRQFQFAKTTQVAITEENNWTTLAFSVSGAFSIIDKTGSYLAMPAGHYQLGDKQAYANEYRENELSVCFTIHYSPEILEGIGLDPALATKLPRPMPKDMQDMVFDILKCPFQETLRDFYYANKVRDILFTHLVSLPVTLPGELNPDQIAKMYEADRIMADNLDGKITIPELARMLGTNFVTLKKNYEKVFGVGLFNRLMQRKMNHIKLLLEKTNKPLKEIANMAGYQTLPGFINAFRKRFNITPNEWRKERRGF